MPFYSDLGEIYTFHSSLQTDLFFSNNMNGDLDVKSSADNTEFRIIPQFGVNWWYPFVRKQIDNVQIIEPIINFVLGPDTQNSSKSLMKTARRLSLTTPIFLISIDMQEQTASQVVLASIME